MRLLALVAVAEGVKAAAEIPVTETLVIQEVLVVLVMLELQQRV
jgi:hypothetical protein